MKLKKYCLFLTFIGCLVFILGLTGLGYIKIPVNVVVVLKAQETELISNQKKIECRFFLTWKSKKIKAQYLKNNLLEIKSVENAIIENIHKNNLQIIDDNLIEIVDANNLDCFRHNEIWYLNIGQETILLNLLKIIFHF